jgi:hypothetical protein
MVISVVDDRAKMIAESQHFLRLHDLRIDPIHDGTTVRPVFGHWHPDVAAVVVDTTGVIHRALAQGEIGQQPAGSIKLEQVADAGARLAIVDLHGGHVESIAKLDHALRMKRPELNGNGADACPFGRSRQA